jgi:hypothetical protein
MTEILIGIVVIILVAWVIVEVTGAHRKPRK